MMQQSCLLSLAVADREAKSIFANVHDFGWELLYPRDIYGVQEKRQLPTSFAMGDLVKVVFSIRFESNEPSGYEDIIERMWVVVDRSTAFGYIGRLDNNPDSMVENDELWSGVEVPFCVDHVVDFAPGDTDTLEVLAEPARLVWPRP